jgi:hypothetical protein
VRDIATTALDVFGALLVVAALALAARDLGITPNVRLYGTAGIGVLVASWLAQGAPLPRRKKGRS